MEYALIAVLGWIVGLVILYAIIKSAVKAALTEMMDEQGIRNWMTNVYQSIERDKV